MQLNVEVLLGRVAGIPAGCDALTGTHLSPGADDDAPSLDMGEKTVLLRPMFKDDEIAKRAPGEGIDTARAGTVALAIPNGNDDPIGRRNDRLRPGEKALGTARAIDLCGASLRIGHHEVVSVAFSREVPGRRRP